MKVKQKSAMPTHKMWAVILATFLVQGTMGVLETYFPGIVEALPTAEWTDDLVEALSPILAGWYVMERMT